MTDADVLERCGPSMESIDLNSRLMAICAYFDQIYGSPVAN